MNKAILYFIVLLMAFVLASCAKSESPINDSTNSTGLIGINGKWTWVSSSGGFAGVMITPESSGHTMVIEFAPENIFNKYVDGKKVFTSPYVFQEKDSIIQYTTLGLFDGAGLGFDFQPEQKLRMEGPNKLWLIDPCCDLFSFEFVRK